MRDICKYLHIKFDLLHEWFEGYNDLLDGWVVGFIDFYY